MKLNASLNRIKIGNAIKYTTSGGVILRAMAVKKEPSDKLRVRFEVEDTGPIIHQRGIYWRLWPGIFNSVGFCGCSAPPMAKPARRSRHAG